MKYLFMKIILFINIGMKTKKKFFLLNYVLTEEDIDTLKAINDNKENIEKFKFENIIKKYDLKDYIIGIFFKNDNKIRFFARFYFNDKLKILNTNYDNITSLDEGIAKNIISEIKLNLKIPGKNIIKSIRQLNYRLIYK